VKILDSNNYNECRAKKSHSHKNMGKLCLNATEMAPTYLHHFQTGISHFPCSASGAHTVNLII